jgi:hypothetical protein
MIEDENLKILRNVRSARNFWGLRLFLSLYVLSYINNIFRADNIRLFYNLSKLPTWRTISFL